MPEQDVEHIKDLIEDPDNAREHNPKNIGMIAEALQEVGAARSIVIDEDNVIRAGVGTVQAAAEAGITRVKVIEADGNEIVAVRRRGLTEEQKRRLSLYDNRTGELSSWDADVLKAQRDAGLDLSGIFEKDDLSKIIGDDTVSPVENLRIKEPTETVWILVAMPIEQWPLHQSTIEALQADASLSVMTTRPKQAPANQS